MLSGAAWPAPVISIHRLTSVQSRDRSLVSELVNSPVLDVEARHYVSGLHLGVQLDRCGDLGVERRVNSDDAVTKVGDLKKKEVYDVIRRFLKLKVGGVGRRYLGSASYGIDSLLDPASSGQSTNHSFSNISVGFTRERPHGQMMRQKYVISNIYVEDTELQLLWGVREK